jgi:hypothetical protein
VASAESAREMMIGKYELIEYLKVERKLLSSKEKVKRQNGKVKSDSTWLVTTTKILPQCLYHLPSYFLPSCSRMVHSKQESRSLKAYSLKRAKL